MNEQQIRMEQDAKNWEAMEKGLREELKQPIISATDSHLKGYIFDSLVFRYITARDAQAELEVRKDGSYYETAKSRAGKDKLRFIQILNEAIGEHD